MIKYLQVRLGNFHNYVPFLFYQFQYDGSVL